MLKQIVLILSLYIASNQDWMVFDKTIIDNDMSLKAYSIKFIDGIRKDWIFYKSELSEGLKVEIANVASKNLICIAYT